MFILIQPLRKIHIGSRLVLLHIYFIIIIKYLQQKNQYIFNLLNEI